MQCNANVPFLIKLQRVGCAWIAQTKQQRRALGSVFIYRVSEQELKGFRHTLVNLTEAVLARPEMTYFD